MTALVRYEALKSALAEALTIDEVKDIRDKAEAMRAYARMANDERLELDAAEYRVRAERRLGQLMDDERKAGKLAKPRAGPGRGKVGLPADPTFSGVPTLAERGVDKNLADRARKMAAMPEDVFERGIQRVRDDVKAGKRGVDLAFKSEVGKRNAESRRDLAKALSDASAALSPTGRQFPCLYADPAWSRKAGIGNRAYENHYTTMSWSDILAMPVAKRLLPDAWGFVWIPRAHLLAPVSFKVKAKDGTEFEIKDAPLAWALMKSWGFDSYSTCCVWTKTDDEFPDDQGTGLIFYDQDELLLVFKRGRGLPKPDTDKKHGSNHRARSERHSAKPAYYRDMINDMTRNSKGEPVPVLELFAREDDDHVLPSNFFTWGNQSKNTAEIECDEDFASDTGEIPEVSSVSAEPAGLPRTSAEPAPLLPQDDPQGAGSPMPDDDLDIPAFLDRRAPQQTAEAT